MRSNALALLCAAIVTSACSSGGVATPVPDSEASAGGGGVVTAEDATGVVGEVEDGPELRTLDVLLEPLPDEIQLEDVAAEVFAPEDIGSHSEGFVVYGRTSDGPTSRATALRVVDGAVEHERELVMLHGVDRVGGLALATESPLLYTVGIDEERRSHVAVWSTGFRADQLLEQAQIDDLTGVTDVARWRNGLLVAGAAGTPERPMLWFVDDGEAEVVALPAEVADLRGALTMVDVGPRLEVWGTDHDRRRAFVLQGPSLDELSVGDLPEAFDRAIRIDARTRSGEARFLGGRSQGSVSGQAAIWQHDASGYRTAVDVTDQLDGGTQFTSGVSRLATAGDVVYVATGDRNWWWTLEGAEIDRAGRFGNHGFAGYDRRSDTTLTYDWDDDVFAWEQEDVTDDFPATSLPIPSLAEVGGSRLTMVSASIQGDGRSTTILRDGVVVGTREYIHADSFDLGDQTLLVGWTETDGGPRPIAFLVDADDRIVELESPVAWTGTSRHRAILDDRGDGTLAVLGHHFAAGGTLEPIVLRLVDGALVAEQSPAAWGEGRGVITRCEQFVVLYDEDQSYFLVRGDGEVVGLPAGIRRCDVLADGRHVVHVDGALLVFDGGVQSAEIALEGVDDVDAVDVAVVDGREVLLVQGRDAGEEHVLDVIDATDPTAVRRHKLGLERDASAWVAHVEGNLVVFGVSGEDRVLHLGRLRLTADDLPGVA